VSARARELRRRSRPSFLARLRAWWVLGVLACVALAALAFVAGNAPQFRIRAIDVNVPAGGPLNRAAVLAAARIDPAANVWLVNAAGIRRRIEALPYVATAAVHRAQFPQPAVTLDVTLRKPALCVGGAHGAATLDATQRVLQTGCAERLLPRVDLGDAALPAPGGTVADPEALRLLGDAKTIGQRLIVRSVGRDRFGGVEAVDAHGVRLRFGSDRDLARKLALVEPIRRSAGNRPLRAIDLRAPDTPIVEFP
jgi:hypothetical protein